MKFKCNLCHKLQLKSMFIDEMHFFPELGELTGFFFMKMHVSL